MYINISVKECTLCAAHPSSVVKDLTMEEILALSQQTVVECTCGYIRTQSVNPCTFNNWNNHLRAIDNTIKFNENYPPLSPAHEVSLKYENNYLGSLHASMTQANPIPDGIYNYPEEDKKQRHIINEGCLKVRNEYYEANK